MRQRPWARRIRRAQQLQAAHDGAESILRFYERLLLAQEQLYNAFDEAAPSGVLGLDLARFRTAAAPLLSAVAEHGPAPLADPARDLVAAGWPPIERLLITYWEAPSDRQFFGKALLQPYLQRLAEHGIGPAGRPAAPGPTHCPRCGGRPQVSVLEPPAGAAAAEGGGRSLVCAACLTSWPFNRVRCACCGESDERQLAYYHSPAFDHQRIDACASCRRYLKTIDLGRLGLAEPLVDEVAGVALDVWARSEGYEKIELNLVGL